MKHAPVLNHNLKADLVEKMKIERTDVRVGPHIKGHPVYKQWQPPLTSLNAMNVLESGLLSFFKYLNDIYTPVATHVEVHRGVPVFQTIEDASYYQP